MRVTVLTGGATAERAVAFASASQIVAALRSRGHEVSVVDTAGGLLDERGERELLGAAVGTAPPAVDQLAAREQRMLSEGLAELPAVRDADVLFLAVHGGQLEGGTLQAVLDVIGVPYTGSGPLASALVEFALDDQARLTFQAALLPGATAAFCRQASSLDEALLLQAHAGNGMNLFEATFGCRTRRRSRRRHAPINEARDGGP